MKIAGMVVLAALTGWFVRGVRFESPDPPPAPRVERPAVVVPSEPIEAPPSVNVRAPLHETARGNRNLFAYREHERPVIVEQPVIQEVVPVAPPQPVVVEVSAPAPVPFHWRYIGTVGTAHTRVAAFKRDGDILTVRAGERIGDFTLRSIGIESAEVDGPDGVRRIPLSSAVPQ